MFSLQRILFVWKKSEEGITLTRVPELCAEETNAVKDDPRLGANQGKPRKHGTCRHSWGPGQQERSLESIASRITQFSLIPDSQNFKSYPDWKRRGETISINREGDLGA